MFLLMHFIWLPSGSVHLNYKKYNFLLPPPQNDIHVDVQVPATGLMDYHKVTLWVFTVCWGLDPKTSYQGSRKCHGLGYKVSLRS